LSVIEAKFALSTMAAASRIGFAFIVTDLAEFKFEAAFIRQFSEHKLGNFVIV